MSKSANLSNCFLTCDGAKVYIETYGEGPPLLMLHGWPLDRRIFTYQIQTLKKYYKIIIYDRRGYGLSKGDANLHLELDDIDRIIHQVAKEPVHLLGMSQGARIAIRYAVTRQINLRSLILQGAVIDGYDVPEPVEERIPINDYVKFALENRLDKFREHWIQHPMMIESQEKPIVAALLKEILNDYDGNSLKKHKQEDYKFTVDVLAKLQEIKLPTLIITGDKETNVRKQHAKKVYELIPQASEVLMHNSGHLSNCMEPEQYNQSVINFLNKTNL